MDNSVIVALITGVIAFIGGLFLLLLRKAFAFAEMRKEIVEHLNNLIEKIDKTNDFFMDVSLFCETEKERSESALEQLKDLQKDINNIKLQNVTNVSDHEHIMKATERIERAQMGQR